MSDNQPTIACDLTAIAPGARAAHQALAKRLLSEIAQEKRELPDGYAFRFAAEHYPLVTEFVDGERLCCPFFTFVLEIGPERGPVWLRVTGGEGVKAFLQAGLAQ